MGKNNTEKAIHPCLNGPKKYDTPNNVPYNNPNGCEKWSKRGEADMSRGIASEL